ncbi:MAG: hypothetical protein ACXVA6_21405 [Isosphaeraceae bacterium]
MAVVAPIAALVVGLGAGLSIMAALTDPTASRQYKDLAAQLDNSQTEVGNMRSVASAAHASASDAAASASQALEQAQESQAALQSQAAELSSQAAQIAAQKAAIDATSITDGTWTVGTDVQPGTYRTAAAVSGQCYWEITKSGSNGSNIIQNDIVQGGFPTVTLSPGQDFKTQDCGTWLRR